MCFPESDHSKIVVACFVSELPEKCVSKAGGLGLVVALTPTLVG